MAKEFLSQKGVPFTDYDVTKDKEALAEMKKISGGALRVPVIAVCNVPESQFRGLRAG
jgi:glutaredoxin